MLIAALALATAANAQASSPAKTELLPASIAAVIAGAQACAGTTTDPNNADQRLAGWQPTSPRFARTDGQTFERDHVYVTLSAKPRHPARGSCVVEARAERDWKVSDLIKALCATFGARRQNALGRVILHLQGDEIMVLTGGQRGDAQYVVLALTYAKRT